MSDGFDFAGFKTILMRLATTPGPTGGEAPRSAVVAELLEQAGLVVDIDDAGSVWTSVGPVTWSDALVYDAHIDVVGHGVADEVLQADGQLTGAGVADNLTAVAMLIMLAGILKRRENDLCRPLKLMFSVGEEGLGNLKGVRQAVKDNGEPPFLFVSWDLSYEEYSVTGLGSRRYKLVVNCPGGHSWSDFGAPNAAEALVALLGEVKSLFQEMVPALPERASYNLGTLAGGEGINVIARQAEATLEFRSQNPDALAQLDSMLKTSVNRATVDKDIAISLETIGVRPASGALLERWTLDLVRGVWERIGATLRESQRSTNINGTLAAGWPSICLGMCRGGNVHREDEYVEVDSLQTGWRLLDALTTALVLSLDGRGQSLQRDSAEKVGNKTVGRMPTLPNPKEFNMASREGRHSAVRKRTFSAESQRRKIP